MIVCNNAYRTVKVDESLCEEDWQSVRTSYCELKNWKKAARSEYETCYQDKGLNFNNTEKEVMEQQTIATSAITTLRAWRTGAQPVTVVKTVDIPDAHKLSHNEDDYK